MGRMPLFAHSRLSHRPARAFFEEVYNEKVRDLLVPMSGHSLSMPSLIASPHTFSTACVAACSCASSLKGFSVCSEPRQRRRQRWQVTSTSRGACSSKVRGATQLQLAHVPASENLLMNHESIPKWDCCCNSGKFVFDHSCATNVERQ